MSLSVPRGVWVQAFFCICSLGIVYDEQNVCEEIAAQMVRESEVEELRAASEYSRQKVDDERR